MRERFMARVIKGDGCWKWAGYHRADGYVNFSVGSKKLKAHRVAHELLVGPIPEGLEVDHICRNRGCLNPEHLRPVTHLENMQNAVWPDTVDTHRDKNHEFTPYFWKQGQVCKICRLNNVRARKGITNFKVVV